MDQAESSKVGATFVGPRPCRRDRPPRDIPCLARARPLCSTDAPADHPISETARLLLRTEVTTRVPMARAKIVYLISSLAQGGAERHLLDLVQPAGPRPVRQRHLRVERRAHFKGDVPAGQPRYRLGSRVWGSPAAFARSGRGAPGRAPSRSSHVHQRRQPLGRVAASVGPRPRIMTSNPPGRHGAGVPLARTAAGRAQRSHHRPFAQHRAAAGRPAPHRARARRGDPNGIDPDRFRPATAPGASGVRDAHGLAADDFVALMAARIAQQKNQDLVMEALARLKAAGALPAAFVLSARRPRVVAGLRSPASALIEGELGLERARAFSGPVGDMPSLYGTADVMLMPSRPKASPSPRSKRSPATSRSRSPRPSNTDRACWSPASTAGRSERPRREIDRRGHRGDRRDGPRPGAPNGRSGARSRVEATTIGRRGGGLHAALRCVTARDRLDDRGGRRQILVGEVLTEPRREVLARDDGLCAGWLPPTGANRCSPGSRRRWVE